MKHLAAYLLLAISGKQPTADDVTGLLTKLGVEADADKVKALVTSLEGKNLDEVIKEGQAKLLSVGGAGGGGGGGGGAAAPAAAGKGDDKKGGDAEVPKEKEKPKEEEANVAAGDLFGGGGGGKY